MTSTAATPYQVIIVGGGPAGLSAALVLGRARRRVLVIDDGQPRNAASRAIHGLVGQEGTPPREFLQRGRAELQHYPSVEWLEDRVLQAGHVDGGFELHTLRQRVLRTRKLVLATGVEDILPEVPGLRRWYGRGVYHCPYCDGWEHRDEALVAYGFDDAHGGELALELRCWSDRVLLCVDGREGLSAAFEQRLQRHGVRVRREPIRDLQGEHDRLARIVFASGAPEPCGALFFYSERRQRSDLAEQLGSARCDESGCTPRKLGRSDIAGLFVIGDASRDVQQVAVALGEGSEAAIAINAELCAEQYC